MSEKAVPLRRQQQVLRLTLGRLKDKSSNVRKSAVQLLTAFLKGNPFAAKVRKNWIFSILSFVLFIAVSDFVTEYYYCLSLFICSFLKPIFVFHCIQLPLEELEGQYEEELKKLKEMDPKAALDLSTEEEDKPQVEKTVTGRELWAAMLPEVVAIVLEVVDEGILFFLFLLNIFLFA